MFTGSFPLDALPDRRILHDATLRLRVLSSPTDCDPHGVLGDKIEASAVTLVVGQPQPKIIKQVVLPLENVLEGLLPLWYALDKDGAREIILTVSNSKQGSPLEVYTENGDFIASRRPIGTGYRRRLVVAAALIDPLGEIEIESVPTPHIGGVVEFLQWHGDRLMRVASISGYSRHRIGSLNLDMPVIGDFDVDHELEVLLADQANTSLGAIERTETGPEVDWIRSLSAGLSTNLGVVQIPGGQLVLGVGLQTDTLCLCVP